MYPIQYQDGNHGIGMGYDEFKEKFHSICEQHMEKGRAKAFAFVFYNAMNSPIRTALEEEGGFNALNKASGKDITIFYLHADAIKGWGDEFNSRFMVALGVANQIEPPCIVFFRVHCGTIEDVSSHGIDDRTNEAHMVVEQLRRLVTENIEERGKEGDLSALKDLRYVFTVITFLKKLCGG
jgi:hypothetical protein